MKKLDYIFASLAILLSDIMCAIVAYNYRDMLCGIEHKVFNALASISFLHAFPFLVGILVYMVLIIKIGVMKIGVKNKRKIAIKENYL